MIKAFIFDLDGTLVQTEALKARSYAKAAVELNPTVKEEQIIEAFKDVVGLSRREVSEAIMERFGLREMAEAKMTEFNVHKPWQAFAQIRMGFYESLISNPEIVSRHLCPYNVGLLKWARQNGYQTGLGTQSHRPQTLRILEILSIKDEFDFIATREDVENPKPDPEIYLLLATELQIAPPQSLVIEDSASGVQAALNAGMGCIAVTTEFTKEGVHKMNNFDRRWIVDSPQELLEVAKRFITENNGAGERVI